MPLARRAEAAAALFLALTVSTCGKKAVVKPEPEVPPDLSFASPVDVGVVASRMRGVVVVDLNRDDLADLAVSCDSMVSIAYGTGGGLTAAGSYPVGGPAGALSANDFDGDGRRDIAIANGRAISVLWGGANGFSDPETLTTFGPRDSVVWIASGDMDGDSRTDLAVTIERKLDPFYGYDFFVSIMASTGANQEVHCLGPPRGTIVDVTEDGQADMVLTWAYSLMDDYAAYAGILEGDGHGSFQVRSSVEVASFPTCPLTVDLDGSPPLEIVVGHNVPVGGLGVIRLKGATPQTEAGYQVGAVTGIAVSDFNVDGKSDVAIAGRGGAAVLLGKGDGTLRPAIAFGPKGGCDMIDAGDVTGDGVPDLVAIGGNRLFLLVNTTVPPPQAAERSGRIRGGVGTRTTP